MSFWFCWPPNDDDFVEFSRVELGPQLSQMPRKNHGVCWINKGQNMLVHRLDAYGLPNKHRY